MSTQNTNDQRFMKTVAERLAFDFLEIALDLVVLALIDHTHQHNHNHIPVMCLISPFTPIRPFLDLDDLKLGLERG